MRTVNSRATRTGIHPRNQVGLRRIALATALGGVLAAVIAACLPLPDAPNCSVMPLSNYWHADVSRLPVHPRSRAYIASIGIDRGLKADFGSGLWEGGPIGIPYTTVAGNQRRVPISFLYDDESDPGPYPIPPDAPIEGGAGSDGDRHIIVVDRDACRLYEIFDARRTRSGSWTAGSGAIFDLSSNELRPAGWTSADAAGLPILPGLVRYVEVVRGLVGHAIRVTAPRTQRAYVWPARHFASSRTDRNLPPMGTWIRLRRSYPTEGFSPQTRPIVEALKRHGMILADNGSPWFLSGVPDERWNNDTLRELGRIEGSDLEVVDTSGMMAHPDSGLVRR